MIKILVFKEIACPISGVFISNVVKVAARSEKKIRGVVEIVVVPDKTMKELNKKYRKKNKTTDVLSFAWNEDKKVTSQVLGQIYISYPQIVKQAKQYQVSVRQEFARMLAHGILHLVGYDHMNKKDEKKMITRQEKIIDNI